jgi:hypothetical protein
MHIPELRVEHLKSVCFIPESGVRRKDVEVPPRKKLKQGNCMCLF